MKRYSPDSPVKHIVSFRVSDDEYRELSRWSRSAGMSLSAMLRTVLTQMENPFKKGISSYKNS